MKDKFEFLNKTIFDKSSNWLKVSFSEKSRNIWRLNRIMSINFPKQASLFNFQHINPGSSTDVWHDVLTRLFTRPPTWMYTKTSKGKTKSGKKYPEKETIKTWLSINEMSHKDLESLLDLSYDETINEILDFEKLLKDKNETKN